MNSIVCQIKRNVIRFDLDFFDSAEYDAVFVLEKFNIQQINDWKPPKTFGQNWQESYNLKKVFYDLMNLVNY